MLKNDDLIALKNLYFEMKKFKIPKSSKNEKLASWLENVIELDSHYAGYALTVSEGGGVSSKDLYNVENLKNSLNSIQVFDDEDKKIFEECKIYIKIINQIDSLLRK